MNEKTRKVAFLTALASLFVAIAATLTEVSFGEPMLALAFGVIFYLFPPIPPIFLEFALVEKMPKYIGL